MTLQHVGHCAELYGTIKLSADHCEFSSLFTGLYISS